jgi:hypothetical protein
LAYNVSTICYKATDLSYSKSIMFADIANVLCIREALWRHKMFGSASIMVGAGFSHNADPLSSTARVMPGWSQMAKSLCHPLYPSDDAGRRVALHEASGTSGFLRLAQEYQAAFGVSSLNDHIRSLVPDTDYRPGDLHRRLLRLPWADVFSTNWDTLLERACADVFDRSYDIVHTVREIPFTMRPRIVKLHGSFPSHEPFIFTEEEYRTYPLKFSPFVNLVQQSMMETIFCLIGFSGDDPNFLHWSGWVRDNLGPGAPKIYLVGWLELSVHRRRMLEARNVMPVDFSALPGADKWPPDLRGRYATEWFIAALELGKPYGATYWPSPPSPPPPPPPHLGAVPPNTQPLPKSEPHSPPRGGPATEREQALRGAIQVWTENRQLYPGWLIAPEGVRETLRHYLSLWISEFSLLPALSALDRLKALSELAWRMDRALLPFPSEQEDAAFTALATVDRSARTIDGEQLPETENWPEMLIGADTLAFALARNARHGGNRARFDQALGFLMPHRDHQAELRNALAYEECLWDLATGDLTSLLTRLDSWMPAHAETLWSLRRAGLLAEMQEHVRACASLEATLVQIRRARRRDVDDLVSLSLEGWALYLALAYTKWVPRDSPALPKDMPEPFERWRALGIVDCNAFSDYRALRRELEANKSQQPEITETRGFDLGHSSMTHHMGRGPSPTIVAAYQMVMLAEITGIPPTTNHMNLFEDGLKAAAKALSADEPWLASQIAIRIEPNDKFMEEVFNRVHIARLPERLVEMLRDALLRRAAFGLAQVDRADRGHDGVSMASSALEILSRVAVRLSREHLRPLFEEAFSYYRSPIFRRMSTFLGSPLSHLLARILESLPRVDILELLPRLFALPLPSEVGPTQDERRWRDPVSTLPDWFDRKLEPPPGIRAPQWEGIVSHLLIAAKGADAVDRGAAVDRLFRLHRWNFLSEDERKTFAAALWAHVQRDQFGLPQHTNLRPWVLLIMPEEQPGQAKETLLRFIAERSRQGDLYVRLSEIGEVLDQFMHHRIPIELPTEVQTDLVTLINSWAVHRAQLRHPFERAMSRRDRQELEAVEGVAAIVPHVPVSEDLLGKIWDKAEAMDDGRDGEVPAFAVYPVLVERRPERMAELLNRLRRSLITDRDDAVRAAVRGVYIWINALEKASQPPNAELDDLVREVGIGIAARRVVLLRPALDFARWLFSEGPEHLRNLIVRDCDHGLTALLEEASYARPDQAFDVPAIRAACLRLAGAMASAGFAQGHGVVDWFAAAKDDPLPEVRNAEGRKSI